MKGLASFYIFSGAMPNPVSSTNNLITFLFSDSLIIILMYPLFVNFIELLKKLKSIYFKRRLSEFIIQLSTLRLFSTNKSIPFN